MPTNPSNVMPRGSSTSGNTVIVRPPAKVESKVQRGKSDLLSVELNDEKIQILAYLISQEQKSWDEYVWRLAEIEMILGPGCGNPKLVYRWGGLPNKVAIYPNRVVLRPNEDDTRQLAYEISQKGPSMQDLHWFIAQRQFISEKIAHLMQ